MNLELNPDGLCLKPNQLLKLRAAIGHTIVCQGGYVWLTQHHDSRDIVLGAGESFVLDHSGLVLVQALEQSAISIAPPVHTARARAAAMLASAVAGLPRNAVGA